MHYADYNRTTGKIIALYDSNINRNIPETAIEISDENWSTFIADQNHWKIDVNTQEFTYIEDPELELPLELFVDNKKKEIKSECEAEIALGVDTGLGFKVKCDLDDIIMFRGGIEYEISKAVSLGQLTLTEEELAYVNGGTIPPSVYIKSEVNVLPMEIKSLDANIVQSTIGYAKQILALQLNQYNTIYRKKWLLENVINDYIEQYNNSEITEEEAKIAIKNVAW